MLPLRTRVDIGSDDNKDGISPSDCLESYSGHSWGVLIPPQRTVGVFNSYKILVGLGVYPSAEMQSVYFTAPANCATGHSLSWGSYPSADIQSIYFTAPADWTTGHSLGRRLTHLRRCSWYILQPYIYIYIHIYSRIKNLIGVTSSLSPVIMIITRVPNFHYAFI